MAHRRRHHGIYSLETERRRLAIEDLVAHVVVDQAVELARRRRALPGAREADREVLDLPGADDDALGRIGRAFADDREEREQTGAEHEEVHQGLAQQPRHAARPSGRRAPAGRRRDQQARERSRPERPERQEAGPSLRAPYSPARTNSSGGRTSPARMRAENAGS
jgi:hypothetical protein